MWSRYQNDIFKAVSDTDRSIVVVARAGSGKTTTIVECAKLFKPGTKALFAAFNKSIATELGQRLPPGVEAKTLHSAGMGLISSRLGPARVNTDKGMDIARDCEARATEGQPYNISSQVSAKSIASLAEFGKNMMLDKYEDLVEIAIEYDLISSTDGNYDKILEITVRAAQQAMKQAAKDTRSIDFNDMIFFPWALKLASPKYDWVIVDEAQDMNAAQLFLARSLLKPDGRMIVVGDDRQAIYSWRGADADALNRMAAELNAITLPLSVTYRCPIVVVKEAQKIVPDLEAAPEAVLGEWKGATDTLAAKPGDFLLSRKNAPLMRECLGLLARGVPATIMGRDIGKSLQIVVKKSKAAKCADLITWLENYKEKEIVKASRLKEDRAEKKKAEITDRCDCIVALCDGLETVAELLARMEQLFSDNSPKSKVMCSSIHRAKGLETETVFVLKNTFSKRPGLRAAAKKEEENLWYVAITRSRHTLVEVITKD